MYSKFNRHSDILQSGFSVLSSSDDLKYPLNSEKMEHQSLGCRIRLSQENKDVLGVTITPEFDPEDNDDIDVSTVAKFDAFDVYESFGEKPDSEPPIPTPNEN